MRCLDMCLPKGLKRDPPMRIEYSHTTGDKRLLFSFDGRSCSLPPLRSRHPWWYMEGERAPEQTPGSPPRSKTPDAATGGFDPTALPAGVAERVGEGDYDALEGWLMHGGHVHAVDATTGLSLLMISASHPRTELVVLLLAQGPAVHIDTQDHAGRTALMHAAARGHHANAEQLLRAGASPHLQDDNGHNAFMHARLHARHSGAARADASAPVLPAGVLDVSEEAVPETPAAAPTAHAPATVGSVDSTFSVGSAPPRHAPALEPPLEGGPPSECQRASAPARMRGLPARGAKWASPAPPGTASADYRRSPSPPAPRNRVLFPPPPPRPLRRMSRFYVHLDGGGHVDGRASDRHGQTALMRAAELGLEDDAARLVRDHGADLSARDADGLTAGEYAIYARQWRVVAELMTLRAEIAAARRLQAVGRRHAARSRVTRSLQAVTRMQAAARASAAQANVLPALRPAAPADADADEPSLKLTDAQCALLRELFRGCESLHARKLTGGATDAGGYSRTLVLSTTATSRSAFGRSIRRHLTTTILEPAAKMKRDCERAPGLTKYRHRGPMYVGDAAESVSRDFRPRSHTVGGIVFPAAATPVEAARHDGLEAAIGAAEATGSPTSTPVRDRLERSLELSAERQQGALVLAV